MYYNFTSDLEVAKKYENRAKKLLEPAYGELTSCNDNRWDLKNDSVSFEVKVDFVSRNTNVVGVEYKNGKKLSGISTTLADYYFLFVFDREWTQIIDGQKHYGWWLGLQIETDTLKELARRPFMKRVMGGDDKKTLMVLVPVVDIREFSYDVIPLTPGILT
jgi:hypothetical protein